MSRWANEIGLLRLAGFAEGATLLCLLLIAVPLKHVWGLSEAVSLLGPTHGLTFVLYFVAAINAVSSGGWPSRIVGRIVVAALFPFGTFANDRLLKRIHEGDPDAL